MPTYSVTITDDADRVLRSWVTSPQQWLTDALNNKIRKRLIAIIEEETNLNYKKLTEVEKYNAIKDIVLPTKVERETDLTEK